MDQTVLEKVKKYIRAVAERFPLKKALLYGSQVKGPVRFDSDIDVAIILEPSQERSLDIWTKLFLLTNDIDTSIEPKLILDETKSVFYDSIKNHAIKVYENGSFITL